jgi:TPR repeat protein
LRWYEAAAIGQQPEAQYNLSTMYEAGEGTERDLVKAHFWALASQYNEYPEATELVNRQVKKMSAEQLSDARRTFAQWTLE